LYGGGGGGGGGGGLWAAVVGCGLWLQNCPNYTTQVRG